jgi:predicted small lipoprotein YifL
VLFKRHDPYPLKLATVSLAIDMNRNLPAMILLVLWSTLGTGCGSGPAMILESDIPAPPEMESRHSSNIDQRSGTLDGGKFTFRGPIDDVVQFTNEMVSLFKAQEWTVVKRVVNPTAGDLVFHKGNRDVEVNFRAGHLNPSMSEVTIIVRQTATPAPPPTVPSA